MCDTDVHFFFSPLSLLFHWPTSRKLVGWGRIRIGNGFLYLSVRYAPVLFRAGAVDVLCLQACVQVWYVCSQYRRDLIHVYTFIFHHSARKNVPLLIPLLTFQQWFHAIVDFSLVINFLTLFLQRIHFCEGLCSACTLSATLRALWFCKIWVTLVPGEISLRVFIRSLHPSLIYTVSPSRSQGTVEPVPADFGREVGYNLGGSQI